MMRIGWLAVAAMALSAWGAQAQNSARPARVANEVLVLATPHLAGWPKDVPLENLSLVLDRLAAWRPQAIAIETIPGDQCYVMRRQAEFREAAETYCPPTEAARAATGLDVFEAIAERDRILATWPANPDPAARRHLAAVMLAAGDRASAMVQWLYLPEAERKPGDGLDAALVEQLGAAASRHREDVAISARLAVRLGLQKLVPMDDQGVSIPIVDEDGYGKALTGAWAHGAPPSAEETAAQGPGLYSPEGVLAAYRMYNAADYPAKVYARDFGATLVEPSPEQFGRVYVTYWETRNLRMAANIREAFGARPGSRVLVIVGASHKGYLDRYLGMMRDVTVVDAARVLR